MSCGTAPALLEHTHQALRAHAMPAVYEDPRHSFAFLALKAARVVDLVSLATLLTIHFLAMLPDEEKSIY